MRLYWNENYPECLYCWTEHGFFCLGSSRDEEVCPGTGKMSKRVIWVNTDWASGYGRKDMGYDRKELVRYGFQFIGRI